MRQILFQIMRPLLVSMALLSLAAVESAAQRPAMELLETKISATRTNLNIVGQVRNISPRPVRGVIVYCDLQDADGNSLEVVQGHLETDPLPADETTSFKLSTKYSERIKRYNVSFGRVFGGPLVTKDSRKQ